VDKHLRQLIQGRARENYPVVRLLQEIQSETRWLDEETVKTVATAYELAEADMRHVLALCRRLRTGFVGQHLIEVCLGMPCGMKDEMGILDAIEQYLAIEVGDTTADGLFTLEGVPCLGLCDQPPAMIIDGRRYGQVTATSAVAILEEYRKQDEND
jgi:NADH-quinone oxidoreductase subunit E